MISGAKHRRAQSVFESVAAGEVLFQSILYSFILQTEESYDK